MNTLSAQRPLDRCPAEIQFMILDHLPGQAVRNFLYTCKDYLVQFLWYFVTRRTDDGLFYATINKDRNLLRRILSIKDVEVNREDKDGETALCFAVRRSDAVTVRALTAHPNIDMQKPLWSAMVDYKFEMAESMLQSGNAKLDATDNLGSTMLHYAVGIGGAMNARLFASHTQQSDFEKYDAEGQTPLHWAIYHGYDEVFDIYFWRRQAQRHGHVLETDLLLWAIRRQREILALEILRLQGFQLAIDLEDDNALHLALQNGLDLVVAELRMLGAGFRDDETDDALRHIPSVRNEAIASRLRHSGVNLTGNESVLQDLAKGADYDTFRLFVLHEGYAVFYNSNCLKYAIAEGKEEVIRKLLRMTTSIDDDVILAAVKSDRPEVLLSILKHFKELSGNVMTRDNMGELLIHAIQHDAISVVRMLLCERHADPCYAKYGRTALSYAAKRGCRDVIWSLLRCDEVAPNLPDPDGQTPLDHILTGHKPHRDTFRRNLELLALDSRTTPSSFDDGGQNMMKSLRKARQYWLVEVLRHRGFEDKAYRKRERKATRVNTLNKIYKLRSGHAR